MTQLGIENGIRLDFRERKALHQHRLGLILATDDANHLIKVQVRREQALEDVQPGEHLLETPVEPASHRADAKLQPLAEDLAQPHDFRPTVEADHVEIDAVITLKIRGRKEVRHQLGRVDLAPLRHDHKTRRMLVIRLIAQILNHRQLLAAHLLGDLLEHLAARGLPGQRLDDDAVLVFDVGRAGLEATVTLLVDVDEIAARRDNLGTSRQIRTLDEFHQRAGARLGVLQQMQAGVRHLAQVVRRNVGGHAHRDAGGAVEQQVRQSCGQHLRFVERAVEVGLPVDRALTELAQQHLGIAGELGLGVAHRGERLRVILRAPVSLPIDDGVAIRKGLRHQHHRLVTGGVAVRVELADHIADGTRGFLVLGDGREPELAHRVDDASLHGLEPIADRR